MADPALEAASSWPLPRGLWREHGTDVHGSRVRGGGSPRCKGNLLPEDLLSRHRLLSPLPAGRGLALGSSASLCGEGHLSQPRVWPPG